MFLQDVQAKAHAINDPRRFCVVEEENSEIKIVCKILRFCCPVAVALNWIVGMALRGAGHHAWPNRAAKNQHNLIKSA